MVPSTNAVSIARQLAPHHVADHARQFQARGLHDFAEAIHFLRPVPDLLHPIPGQVAEFADRRWRHETRPQQAAFEQLRQPLAVFHIRLAPRDVLQLLHVDQQQRKGVLKHVVDPQLRHFCKGQIL